LTAGQDHDLAAHGVSVVLPSFNRLDRLRETIASVLAQTFSNFELIIADDGSDALTRAWLQSLHDVRIRLLLAPHRGNPSAVRNAAIVAARGAYVAFIDSDDVWVPERLARQLEVMQASPRCEWSYCRTRMIDEHGELLPESGFKPWLPHAGAILELLLRHEASVATSAVVVTRRLVNLVGGFDEGLLFSEHNDLWARLALRSEVSVCDEPLVRIRTHGENYTRDRAGVIAGWDLFYSRAERYLPDPQLQSLCRELRSIVAMDRARIELARRNFGAGLRSFLVSIPLGFHRRNWWRHLAASLSRPWTR
jgi:glycosyltransferase involved in cell wall biosynthesis